MASVKKSLGAAAQGASMGAAAGPYGALIGGGIGLISSLFGDDDGGGDGLFHAYDPNASSFAAPDASTWFGAGKGAGQFGGDAPGGGNFWAQQGTFRDASQAGVGMAQQDRRGSRTQQQGALGMMKQYAEGKESAARRQSAAATQQAQRAIGSQVASAPGGYNPAAVRAGIQAQSGAGQRIAGQTAALAAQEQAAARQAYAQGIGQMRGQDVQSQMAEQTWWQQQQQAAIAKKNLMAKYLQLGMTDREAQRAASMQLEQMRFLTHEGAEGRGLAQQQITNQQFNANRTYDTNMMMGGMGAGSDALAAYYKSQGGGGNSGGSNSGVDYWDWD